MLKIEKNNGIISTYTDYNIDYISRARDLGGKWNSAEKAWEFGEEKEELVMEALAEYYGYSEDGETVKVKINVDDYDVGDKRLKFGSILVATRYYRDYRVKMENDCYVAKGGFDSSGGSRKSPKISAESGTEIIIPNVPKAILDKIDTPYEIIG